MTRVNMVMPLMGLVPMVAMARAATGAKKKEMIMTTVVATRAGTKAFWMPRPKLRKDMVPTVHVTRLTAIIEPARVRSVRTMVMASAAASRFISAFRLLMMLRIMLGME